LNSGSGKTIDQGFTVYQIEDEMHRACSTNGERRNACRNSVGKPEGARPLGRQRHRWVDNIKMDLIDIGWGALSRIVLAQDRDKWKALANMKMNL
jgi:hypothetical protein